MTRLTLVLQGRSAARVTTAAALALAGTIALSGHTPPAGIDSRPESVRLVGVSSEGSALLIESSEPVAYVVNQPDPLTLLVELRNVDGRTASSQVPRRDLISAVTVEHAVAGDGKALARVRVALARPADFKARSVRNTIRIELTPKAAARPNTRDGSGPVLPVLPPGSEAGVAPATMLEHVRTKHAADRTTVTLTGNGQLTPASVNETAERPRRLVLDFPQVGSRVVDQDVNSPLVRKVRVAVNSREPLVTRVVIEIDDRATYHVERGGDAARELAIVFAPAQGTSTILLTSTPPVPVEPEPAISMQQALANGSRLAPTVETPAQATRPVSSPIVLSNAGAARTPGKAEGTQGVPPPTPSQLPTSPPPPPPTPQPSALTQTGERQYIGVPISIDFSGMDLRTVLRAIIAQGGLNVVFDDGVQGSIDIVLNDIPWDQAFETILRAKKLGYVAEGTIIRIAPIAALAEEEAERRKLTDARALAGDLAVRTFSLSYARATEMSPLLTRSALSARGQIQVDARTNTLIITDLPDRLQTAANLITGLDRPEPQVEVEARIVQTTRDFARAMGVQWGLNGRMTPEIGNTTNLAFPNRGTLGGRTGSTNAPNDPRSVGTDATGTAINLPVTGASSAIGLALGAVNGAFNLDLALSALERSGKGRVLSTPRLTTQNNIAAEVGQGIQIPLQTVANNTVTVTFKEALLKLMVTPQITAAGTVIMQITIENATADFSRQVNGIPPIDTQRAQTQVQVNDGATTVIGGIFVSREQSSTDRTPMLSRIPLLGWLFRRDSEQDESRELLIFITPRILKAP